MNVMPPFPLQIFFMTRPFALFNGLTLEKAAAAFSVSAELNHALVDNPGEFFDSFSS